MLQKLVGLVNSLAREGGSMVEGMFKLSLK